jgi:hypothetical protein
VVTYKDSGVFALYLSILIISDHKIEQITGL